MYSGKTTLGLVAQSPSSHLFSIPSREEAGCPTPTVWLAWLRPCRRLQPGALLECSPFLRGAPWTLGKWLNISHPVHGLGVFSV